MAILRMSLQTRDGLFRATLFDGARGLDSTFAIACALRPAAA